MKTLLLVLLLCLAGCQSMKPAPQRTITIDLPPVEYVK